ncbi:MAG: creatininase family protein, partial [Burkholderiales bacterium]
MRLAVRSFLFSVVALVAHPALAQAPRSVYVEELTWTEVRDAVRAGSTTVIVPVGGTEQSGPDVALGKHNARVKALAQRIAEGLGNALVAPVVAYVPEGNLAPPSSHMRYPGTITVPRAAFVAMLESAARSFEIHGFREVVFLGDHGGYQGDLRRVAARLNALWAGRDARAFVPPQYYAASSKGYAAILRAHGYPDAEIGSHAGLADTSLLLAVAPQMVRLEQLRSSPRPGPAQGVYG